MKALPRRWQGRRVQTLRGGGGGAITWMHVDCGGRAEGGAGSDGGVASGLGSWLTFMIFWFPGRGRSCDGGRKKP